MIRLALLLALAGCATTPPAPVACSATALTGYNGKTATPDLLATLKSTSGARLVRTIDPGMMVTMDYRPDRLNVQLHEARRITALRCG